MDKYQCPVCGTVYDPEEGAEGIAPGTPVEDWPDDWQCVVCGTYKMLFEKVG